MFLSERDLTFNPVIARTRHIPWSEIDGFSVGTLYVIGGGGRSYPVVQAQVAHRDKPLKLTSAAGARTDDRALAALGVQKIANVLGG